MANVLELITLLGYTVDYLRNQRESRSMDLLEEWYGGQSVEDVFLQGYMDGGEVFLSGFRERCLGQTLQLCADHVAKNPAAPSPLYHALISCSSSPAPYFSLLEQGVQQYPNDISLRVGLAQAYYREMLAAQKEGSWSSALSYAHKTQEHMNALERQGKQVKAQSHSRAQETIAWARKKMD